jgi:hypothetical protein
MSENIGHENVENDSRSEMLAKLGELALPHIETSSGKLVLLPPDLSNLDYHISPETGPLDDPKIIERTATLADKRFPAIQEQMDALAVTNGSTFAFIDQLLKDDKNKNNLVFATSHGELVDIVYLFTAFCSTMAKLGYEDILKKHRRGIIVSHIVDRIGLQLNPNGDPLPADQALALLFNDVWKSYPNTESVAGLRGTFIETRKNNISMVQSVNRSLGRGGLILAMSPSGRQDKPMREDPDTTVLHAVTGGTMELMKHGNTYTLFAAVNLDSEDPQIQFSGEEVNGTWVEGVPKRITDDQEVNDEMDKLAATLVRMTGRNYMYKPAKQRSKSRIKRALKPEF